MDDQILGQICLFAFPYAPKGWALCQGQLLPVSQYSALYTLMGTTYGGDGTSTFALPDLRARVPLGQTLSSDSPAYAVGQTGGNENVNLTASQMPAHNHMLVGSGSEATVSTLNGNVLASANGAISTSEEAVTVNTYAPADTAVTADASAISMNGNGQPIPVMQPYLAMNYCIALQGAFPSRS